MKPSSAKAKGRRCAQEVKNLMQKVTITTAIGDDDIVVTSAGVTGEDLTLSPLARSVYPLRCECKNVEKLNIWEALEQAEQHNKAGKKRYEPAVFFKRNKSKLFVAVDAEFFLKLCCNFYDGFEEGELE